MGLKQKIKSMIQIELIKDPTADSDDLDYKSEEKFEYQMKSIDPRGRHLNFSI